MTNREYERLNSSIDESIPQSARQIFDEIQTLIKNSSNNQLKIESEKPYTIILKHIILSGIDGFQRGTSDLLDYIQTVVQTERTTNGNLFRFSAHLALIYQFASFQYRVSFSHNHLEFSPTIKIIIIFLRRIHL
jgi:hypothetical protein